MSSSTPIAEIQEHKPKLFEMYQKCRFNEIASHRLMRRNMRIEKAVRWSTVVLILISFLTGSVSYLAQPAFAPAWAAFSALASVVGIYSLLSGSATKQFHWFSIASRFRSIANEVEWFSELVRMRKITENELLESWQRFVRRIEETLGQAGPEFPEYCDMRREKLDRELSSVLVTEGKLNPGARP